MVLRTLLVGLTVAICVAAQEKGAESRPATIPFVIVHTNDVHGQIRPVPDPRARSPRSHGGESRAASAENAPLVGGYQEMVEAIDEERSAVARSVLVDAGDWFQGTPEGSLSQGRSSIELMNATGYDFAVLGNHDFDAGPAALVDMLELARFRVFGRNLRLEKPRPAFPDTRTYTTRDVGWYVMQLESTPAPIVTVGGVRIAFDGMLPEETPRIVTPSAFEGFAVRPEIECARRIRESLDRPYPKADALVLVNHIGKDHNVAIAREVPGIDVIIGGHNHGDVLENGVTVPSTGTLIAQAAASTAAIGVVTLEIDPAAHRIVSKNARVRHIEPKPGLRVPRVAPIIERYERSVAAAMDVDVATSERALGREHDLGKPSPLGNWITQVMLDRTGAEVAIHNTSGVRAGIPAGAVRVRDFFQISPFGNKLTVLSLKGADLRAILDKGGPACFIRGLEIRWTKGSDGRTRILKVLRQGREVGDGDVVKVVTTDYLASGGSNFQGFKDALERRDLGVTLFDATVEAARAQKVLHPPEDNPWVREDAR